MVMRSLLLRRVPSSFGAKPAPIAAGGGSCRRRPANGPDGALCPAVESAFAAAWSESPAAAESTGAVAVVAYAAAGPVLCAPPLGAPAGLCALPVFCAPAVPPGFAGVAVDFPDAGGMECRPPCDAIAASLDESKP